MKAIEDREWMPVDGLTLEDRALDVTKAPFGNFLVVAGPGAGKTELLAQRACFLLQTNNCKFPHRILAISFKRDAAFNLKERVSTRAGADLSTRFDSLTYDSFAKQMLDRFKQALPSEYLVPDDYRIIFEPDIIEIYREVDLVLVNTSSKEGIIEAFTRSKLPIKTTSEIEKTTFNVWQKALQKGTLTFKMVMRLAELIIDSNPRIKSYLQITYDYVFLDEFQDTTSIQYSFLKTCFYKSNKVLTAVGDDKQRIMLWAGAQKTVFEDFQKDFDAARVPLKMNFRSAPVLVEVQNRLMKTLLGKNDFATPSRNWKSTDGECLIWEFGTQEQEAEILANAIEHWVTKEGIDARQICILVKGSLPKYVSVLVQKLKTAGVNARDEGLFQEFLTDETILYLLHSLYLVLGSPKHDSKSTVFNFLSLVNNELSDEYLMRLENRLSRFVQELRDQYKARPVDEKVIKELVQKIIGFANFDRIRGAFPVYKQKDYLTKVLDDFEKSLGEEFKGAPNNQVALDRFFGVDTVPIMTVHKSKGLEYHTVVFVGLEDGAFWSFATQPDEDKSTFFVALSRAKLRVVFTFSKIRDTLRFTTQTRSKIDVIFTELKNAGAVVTTF